MAMVLESASSRFAKDSIDSADEQYVENPVTKDHLATLVYVSSAVKPFSQDELVELVQKAREFNAVNEITGMLLYKDQSFMQVLEGPWAEVQAVMSKIQRDPRHTGILRLVTRPIRERQFEAWPMGFRDLDTLSIEEIDRLGSYLPESFATEKFLDEPADAYRLLQFFAGRLG